MKQKIYRPVLVHNATGLLFVPLRIVQIDFFGEKKELIECALVNVQEDGRPPHRIGTKPEQVKLFFYSQMAMYHKPLCGCDVHDYHVLLPEKIPLEVEKFAGKV